MSDTDSPPFGRRPGCPDLGRLQAYCAGDLGRSARRRVCRHLAGCDFCGAAAQMMSKHPPGTVQAAPPASIPLHVFLLAEAILTDEVRPTSVAAEMGVLSRGRA